MRVLYQRLRLNLIGAVLVAVVSGYPTVLQATDVQAMWREADAKFAEELGQLANRCDELNAPGLANQTREWRIPRDPSRLYLFDPPQSKKLELEPKPAEPTRQLEWHWRRKMLELRREQAKRLVEAARAAVNQGEAGVAYRWLHEALHEDPDNETARAALGFRVVNGRWRLPGGQPRASAVRVANRKLQFPARRHWRVESEHFRLLTDHSSQAGLEAVQELERVFSLWRQAFFEYWGNAEWLQQRLDSPAAPRRASTEFAVVLFRDRDKYVSVMGANQPLIAKTVGIYLDQQRSAYFYVGGEETLATRYHEAGHQFFSEAAGRRDNVGRRANFWVVEGVALYMESLQEHEGYFTLGGLDANRVQYARYRAYNERVYVPLDELAALSRDQLQKREDIRLLYSQSSGLATFFLDPTSPGRRSAFLSYLRGVYRGEAESDSLKRSLNTSLAEVDRQYLLSMMVDDEAIRVWPQQEYVNLSLGHTKVTNDGLAALGAQSKLRWLDLAAAKITDAAAPTLSRFQSLEQLNLESTSITNASLPHLAKLSSLEELDLSSTSVSNQGLASLAPLKNLKILWLTSTDVDDDGIQALASLQALEVLRIRGTAVTPDGLKRLRAKLPQLKE